MEEATNEGIEERRQELEQIREFIGFGILFIVIILITILLARYGI